jgi:hypothetical protein
VLCKQKSTVGWKLPVNGAFFIACRLRPSRRALLTFTTLVSRASQQLAMFMFSHLLSALFDNTTQWITPFSAIFARLHSTLARVLSTAFSLARQAVGRSRPIQAAP